MRIVQILILLAALALPGSASLIVTTPVTAQSGNTLHVFGTITNNEAVPINLDNINVTTTIPGALPDYTSFFNNTPPSLNPGGNTGLVNLFDLLIPGNTAIGPYTASVFVSDNGSTYSYTGSLDINVTPEPATAGLTALALAALLASHRRRRSG
jgi:MYXO-CTERM domain-containing protein